jgi:hypothetical protein
MVLIQDRRKFEWIIEQEGWFGIIWDAVRYKTNTRRGSNPARSSHVQMAHQQRAEIFALPFAFLALRLTAP